MKEKEATFKLKKLLCYPILIYKFNKVYSIMETFERKVNYNQLAMKAKELSWTNQDNEIKCPLDDGVLLIKIPYFRWRINGRRMA